MGSRLALALQVDQEGSRRGVAVGAGCERRQASIHGIEPGRALAWVCPVVYGFYNDQLPANPRQELLRYLAFTGTTWVLVDARAPGPWAQFLRETGGVRSEVGGVVRWYFDPAAVRAQVSSG